MTEYWVTYRLNGIKHLATKHENRESAVQLMKRRKHVCKTFNWDLTEISIKEVG